MDGNWGLCGFTGTKSISFFSAVSRTGSFSIRKINYTSELIHEYNEMQEIPVFFMTWGRENGDDMNCPNWPPVCTYEGVDDLQRKI